MRSKVLLKVVTGVKKFVLEINVHVTADIIMYEIKTIIYPFIKKIYFSSF